MVRKLICSIKQLRGGLFSPKDKWRKNYEANCMAHSILVWVPMSHRKYQGGFPVVQNTIYSKGRGEHWYSSTELVLIPKIHSKSCVEIIGNL